MAAIELAEAVENELRVKLPVEDLLDGPSIEQITATIQDLDRAQEPSEDAASEGDPGPLNPGLLSPGPLSPGQEALWFLTRLNPDSTDAYHLSAAFRWPRSGDSRRWAKAVQTLVDRHGVLRTAFIDRSAGPQQIVQAEGQTETKANFETVDAEPWADDRLRRELAVHSRRPFDLAQPPAFRVTWFDRANEGAVVLFVFHHLIADFRSIEILVDELDRLLVGESLSQPPSAHAYRDHAIHFHEWLATPEAETALDEFEALLRTAPRQLDLPTDRPRPSLRRFRGRNLHFAVPSDVTDELRTLAAWRSTTLYSLLLAGFGTLLARWGAQTSVVVGSPEIGRDTSGPSVSGQRRASDRIDDVVGYFVNPLPIHLQIDLEARFESTIEETRRAARSAFRLRRVPFPKLAARIQPEPDPSRSPIFQAMLVMLRDRPATLTQERGSAEERRSADLPSLILGDRTTSFMLGGEPIEAVDFEAQSAQLDLSLYLGDPGRAGRPLTGRLELDRDLFDDTTGRRLISGLLQLLRGAATEPGRRLAELPILSAAERHQLVSEFSGLAAKTPPRAVADLFSAFETQAFQHPEREAVRSRKAAWTYGHLAERAERVARALAVAGIGRGDRVAVAMPRTPDLIAALLGVLRVGAAYVPLDPTYPEARLRYMIDDSQAAAVLGPSTPLGSGKANLPHLDSGTEPDSDSRSTRLRIDPATLEEGSPIAPPSIDPSDLAYVIYTSGSTGRPKGVAIEHRSALARLAWAAGRFGSEELGGLAATTSICFDLSVFEIFAPLSTGGRVLLFDNALALSTMRTTEKTEKAEKAEKAEARETSFGQTAVDGVRLINTVPSALTELLHADAIPPGTTTINLAGEPLSSELAQAIGRSVSPTNHSRRLHNLYGPSEDTTYSTEEAVSFDRDTPPTIGKPLPGTRAYVLDSSARALPRGTVGELHLAGCGLARGYLDRPALTADRFRPDPFSPSPGARCYRTGDRVRWRPDGRLEFLGRLDSQIKLRGFRIELDEVETALGKIDAVAEACAAVGERGDRLVAYVVTKPDRNLDADGIRAALRQSLPEPMVPDLVNFLAELPRTPNGKLDRKNLPTPIVPTSARSSDHAVWKRDLDRRIAAIWCEVLDLEQVGPNDSFFDLGGHSLLAARLDHRLHEAGLAPPGFGLVDLFRYPTVAAQAERFRTPSTTKARRPVRQATKSTDAIAIVGLAGRFPGAGSTEELWTNLVEGVESIRRFSAEEMIAAGLAPEIANAPKTVDWVPAAGVLDDADLFDAEFFGIAPSEARTLDPQHRLLLECAWETLENAGYDSARVDDRIGIFASVGVNTYLLQAARALMAGGDEYLAMLGNDKDFAPSRIAYKLGLDGPAVNVQTACSSSLVAVHLACRSLHAGEAEMALAGGVAVRFPQQRGYRWQPDGILSPDGHCRAFDHQARGTVFGGGVGMVLLKPLERALDDGDSIRAVIRGSAINNDGARKIGYTAPSIDGQIEVISAALEAADLTGAEVDYIETHGTATELGDPIEVAALAETYGERPADLPPIGLGAVKPNLGHLDSAAGITGLIKTILALERETLPTTLHFEAPNPRLELDRRPFRIVAETTPWPRDARPRRAGVSAFGIGGTNAHLVVEEAPTGDEPVSELPQPHLIVVSARSSSALEETSSRWAERLRQGPTPVLADISFTSQVGRRAFEHRRFVVATTATDAAAGLAGVDEGANRRFDGVAAAGSLSSQDANGVVFLFPGQGAQRPGMAQALYEHDETVRSWIDRAASGLAPHFNDLVLADLAPARDLRRLLFGGDSSNADRAEILQRTAIAQPALYTVGYALGRYWLERGIEPAAMLGHSVGDYVAAALAGVFSFEDGLTLVAERGRLMDSAETGAMVAVAASADSVASYLDAGIHIAAFNAPEAMVLAGPIDAVDALTEELTGVGIEHRRLRTSHAFHTPAMADAAEAFASVVSKVNLKAPERQILSSQTGDWLTDDQARSPEFWADQIVRPVRFADALAHLAPGMQDGAQTSRPAPAAFLEVGPGRGLLQLVAQQSGLVKAARIPTLNSTTLSTPALSHPSQRRDGSIHAAVDDRHCALEAIGRLWLAGIEPDWQSLHRAGTRRRVPLPTYPFERQRFWIADDESALSHATPIKKAAESNPATETPTPDAEDSHRSVTTAFVAPESELQTRLASAWSEVLGVSPIGAHDDFFELGGHSLLAGRLTARLRDEAGVDIGVADLFGAPTVAALARELVSRGIDRSSHRTGDQAQQARDRSTAAPSEANVDLPAIEPRPVGTAPPLGFAQERLWFLARLDPTSPAYHLPFAARLRGGLDRSALSAALDAVVARHEALRTSYENSSEGTHQRIAPSLTVHIPTVDLVGLSRSVRDREVRRQLIAAAGEPFDLQTGPLIRARLIVLGRDPEGEDDHLLALTLHHSIADGWSMGVLIDELDRFYERALNDRQLTLDLPRLQFADFACRQRATLDDARQERLLEYWRLRLDEAPSALELPLDRPRPPIQRLRGRNLTRSLPTSVRQRFEQIAAANGATPFMAWLAVTSALMSRLTGNDELVVGTPVANRPLAELETMIGSFVNTLALRLDLGAQARSETEQVEAKPDSTNGRRDQLNGSLKDFLRVQRPLIAADFDHQELPFDRLVDDLAPARDLSRSPIFQLMVAWQNAAPRQPKLGDVEVERLEPPVAPAQFDLSIAFERVSQQDDGWQTNWTYDTDLFEPTTVERWARWMETLAAGAASEPDRPLATLDLLSAAQRQQMLIEWSATTDPAEPTAIHHAVLRQAARTPDAIAVVVDNRSLSYRQLIDRAQHLANTLLQRGIKPETRIGICLDRTISLPETLLGVLMAGAAYVPLDPAYPKARLRFMIEDSEAQLVVADESGRRTLDDLSVDIVESSELIAKSAPGAPEPMGPNRFEGEQFATERLAYVIYTSGSTGTPKGVAISHRSASILCAWAAQHFEPNELEGMLATTSLSFDLSIFELFASWSAGGTVFLCENALAIRSMPGFAATRLLNTVPSALAELLKSGSLPTSLRTVNLAGEPLPRSLVDSLLSQTEVQRISNLYGPSEDTTYSTWAEVGLIDDGEPTIGRPLPGTTVRVVDSGMRPVPPGVDGELLLGGKGLARGYLNRPGRTAATFVPDPFADPFVRSDRPESDATTSSGDRLYRTGDRVRWRNDGQLAFLGRIDRQVKLRGFRIELGEIEIALTQHPGIATAAAILRHDGAEPRLVAYYERSSSSADSPDSEDDNPGPEGNSDEALRSTLGSRLPTYMLPNVFVCLEEMPRTPSGKIDRGRLPAPEGDQSNLEVPFAAPETESELILAEIWARHLEVSRVGIDDDFFVLGGHSLLATRVLTEINETFDIELPIQNFLVKPTIRRMIEGIVDTLLEQEAASDEAADES